MPEPPAVVEFGDRLATTGFVTDLFVGGSLATGDYAAGISDIDLVAVVAGRVDGTRRAALVGLHRDLDRGIAASLDLGCVYVADAALQDRRALHPTWTHGRLVQRVLSGVTRAELLRHGYAVFGRTPDRVLPAMTGDDVRGAVRDELAGYWSWAARRPWVFLDPVTAELGLTTMARARQTLATGELLTKTAAIADIHAPTWLIDQLRSRRQGGEVVSPRLRTARIAWRDVRDTAAQARKEQP